MYNCEIETMSMNYFLEMVHTAKAVCIESVVYMYTMEPDNKTFGTPKLFSL